MGNSNEGQCWPEQEAVRDWADRHLLGLNVSHGSLLALKDAVTVPRLKVQAELERWKDAAVSMALAIVRSDEHEKALLDITRPPEELAEAAIGKLKAYWSPIPFPSEKLGDAFDKAAAKLACDTCKGKGQFYDCEDEEMIRCHHCRGTGLSVPCR